MNKFDAAKILKLSGDITAELVKNAYREACKIYHPDINPAGDEMMKFINNAYDVLKDFTGKLDPANDQAEPKEGSNASHYPEALNDALNALYGLPGLTYEICGAWLWVGGNTKEHKDRIKEAGFKWASRKKLWFFRPDDYKSRNRKEKSMNDIRDKWGTTRPEFRTKKTAIQRSTAQ